MKTLGERIKEARRQAGLSQSTLAEKVGVSYAQIGRYETKGAQPPAEIIQKIARVLGVNIDYLLNGTSEEKALAHLHDKDLLQQFQAIEELEQEDQLVIKKLIDAFIFKKRVQQIA